MKNQVPDPLHPIPAPTRRAVLYGAAAGLAAAATPLRALARDLEPGAPGVEIPPPETLVTQLFRSLSPEQRKLIVLPFDHELRGKVDANWRINKSRLGKTFDGDQQALIREILSGLHSEEHRKPVMDQISGENDGLTSCSVAIFGAPGEGDFEFVLTGRHVTRRCDGNSVKGAAFGGPLFYGHASRSFNEQPHHPGNVYWFQAERANQVYQALDGRQRELALLGKGRAEKGTDTVRLAGRGGALAGIPTSDLSEDQQELVRGVLADLLAPFREVDVRETLKLVDAAGFDDLHMSFYKNQDIGGDGVWDVWQIEGPSMVWYFRGSPHVHVWAHVRAPEKV